MTQSSAEQPRGSTATAVVGTILWVGAFVLVPIIGAVVYFGGVFSGDDPPDCDRDPHVLEWVDRDRQWQRSDPFEPDEAQTVQVDVGLWRDGGVIQVGATVYVVAAGEPFRHFGEGATPTTRPFRSTKVGHGIDAVNELIRLDAGVWEHMVGGGASPAEVRWPC